MSPISGELVGYSLTQARTTRYEDHLLFEEGVAYPRARRFRGGLLLLQRLGRWTRQCPRWERRLTGLRAARNARRILRVPLRRLQRPGDGVRPSFGTAAQVHPRL